MKISIAFLTVILAVTIVLGIGNHRRISQLRETYEKLFAQADRLGIPTDAAGSAEQIARRREERANHQQDVKPLAVALIDLFNQPESENASADEIAENQQRMSDLFDRMSRLDLNGFKTLIASICDASEVTDPIRVQLLKSVIDEMAENYPQAALTCLTEATVFSKTSQLAKNQGMQLAGKALSRWAATNPVATAGWLRENGEKFPELINWISREFMMKAMAANDPKAAFRMVGLLEFPDEWRFSQAVGQAADAAQGNEGRKGTLAALNHFLETVPDEKSRRKASDSASQVIAMDAAREGFEAGSKWIDSANFTQEQMKAILDQRLYESMKGDEPGKWIEWMASKNLMDDPENRISSMMQEWTNQDYQPAGRWLEQLPDGPVRDAAISGYAQIISRTDPETAADWAETLPPGEERQNTLGVIFRDWPKEDPASAAAAEAFAKKHGLK